MSEAVTPPPPSDEKSSGDSSTGGGTSGDSSTSVASKPAKRLRKKKVRRSADRSPPVFMDYLSDLDIVDLYLADSVSFPSVLYDNYDFDTEQDFLAKLY